ncbi:MAG: transposase, partial [Actinophytocola sp.]|nr:transposase [Actinophytocola sp.]
MSSVHDGERVDALGDLAGFRREFYRCLPQRADALFELTDAV